MQQNRHQTAPSTVNQQAQHSETAGGSSLIRLADMPNHVPPGRNGKKRHKTTIFRYATRGVAGVRLEVWRLPDGWYSSREAWDRFVEQLTAARRTGPSTPRVLSPTAAKRQNSVEAEIEAVRASIGRQATASKDEGAPEPSAPKPRWDADRAELWFGNRLCKRFRQKAKNQRIILATFQDDDWPSRIDDPLSPDPDPETDNRQRLADAVRRLNKNPCILFELDGTSEGILWAPRQP
ncbi:MAG: hypothetical protein HYX68_27020 [Planctomycetes bacterium]|nr:hypothetical protein [Planctomycetota bacterium]